jgi:RNA polymerase sigma factor (sigma-70 family)
MSAWRRTSVITLVAETVTELRSCTPDQFGTWIAPHVRAMSLLAERLTSYGERDDVVQETLARAWAKRAQFDPARGTPAAWLLAITADQARRARTRRRPLIGMLPARVRPIDDELDLETAIGRLSGRQRLAVDCHYFVGLSVAETAAVMGCAEGTVKSTLNDARLRLRRLLEVR